MGGKEKMILDILRRSKGKYLKEVARENGLNYATLHKWTKIFVLMGKVKVKRFGGLVVIEDVEDENGRNKRNGQERVESR